MSERSFCQNTSAWSNLYNPRTIIQLLLKFISSYRIVISLGFHWIPFYFCQGEFALLFLTLLVRKTWQKHATWLCPNICCISHWLWSLVNLETIRYVDLSKYMDVFVIQKKHFLYVIFFALKVLYTTVFWKCVTIFVSLIKMFFSVLLQCKFCGRVKCFYGSSDRQLLPWL